MKKSVKRGAFMIAALGVLINSSPIAVKAALETPVATSPTGIVSEVGMVRAGYAGSIHRTSADKSFSSDWQSTAYAGDASLTYGYNTVLINEDFAWANHSTRDHTAEVKNDKGAFGSSKQPKGKVAKIEVSHKGISVQYQNTWYD